MSEETASFGRYELLRRIAVGGMAEVYLARLVVAEGVERLLVIKRVLPHLARNREFIERFIDEARIALPLTHAAITAVFDFGRVVDDYYIAMEYVPGTNLAEAIERAQATVPGFPVDMALYIVAQVASGLDYAHRAVGPDGELAGIVHRDVSPQNILLSFSGGVKLTDFGIAQVRSRMEITSQMVRGKPNYLSPEQAQGMEVDRRCDLFGLGVVLYEMLTGLRAFEDDSAHATMVRIVKDTPPPPSARRSEIGPEIDAICMRMLAKDPEERYSNGADVQADLTRVLHERTPGFTSQELATWLAELLPEERRSAERKTTDTPPDLRERLIGRLRDNDVAGQLEQMSTGELLELNTVSVPVVGVRELGEGARRPLAESRQAAAERSRYRRLAGALGLGAVAVVLAIVLATGPGGGGDDTSLTVAPTALAGAPGSTGGADTGWTAPVTATPVLSAGSSTPAVVPTSEPETAAPVPTGAPASARTPGPGKKYVRPPDEPAVYGIVTFTALPWAVVTVDGRKLGTTPHRQIKLTPGTHRVRFVNPYLELVVDRVITVKADTEMKVGVDMEREGTSLPGP